MRTRCLLPWESVALRVSIYAELSCKLLHLTLHLLSQTQFDDVTELSFRHSKVFCMKISHCTGLNPTPTLLSFFLVFGSNIFLKVSIPFLNTHSMRHSATSCHIISLWKKSSSPSIPWRMHRGCKSRIKKRSSNLFQIEEIMGQKILALRKSSPPQRVTARFKLWVSSFDSLGELGQNIC